MESLFNGSALSTTAFVFVLSTVIKCSMILFVAFLLVRIMKRTSSAGRHLVCSIALSGVLALPLFSMILPRWQVTVFPGLFSNIGPVEAALQSPGDSQKNIQTLPDSGEDDARLVPGTLSETDKTVEHRGSVLGNLLSRKSLPGLFLGAWLLGSVIILLRYLVGRILIWRATQHAKTVSDESLIKIASKLIRRFEITRPIRMLESDKIQMPLTWGLFKPRILLPADIENWPVKRRQIVLLHEFAHVKQLDSLTQILMQLTKALYWFNPFVWIFNYQFLKERESACDDFVLKEGPKATDYAKLLLDVAVNAPPLQFSSLSTVAMARRSQLEGRLLAILNPKLSRRKINHLIVAVASVFSFALIIPLAAIQPNIGQDSNTPEEVLTQLDTNEKLMDEKKSRETEHKPAEAVKKSESAREKEKSNIKDQDQDSDKKVVRALIAALKDPDLEVRIEAAETLGRLKKTEAIEPLTSALKDENWKMRMEVVEALGDIGKTEVVPSLIKALKDTYWQVRYEAADALGDFHDKRAVQPLEQLVNDENRKVRMEAISSLGDIEDPGAVQTLTKAMKDTDWEIRKYAADALYDIESPESSAAFLSALNDAHDHVRLIAIEALGDMKVKQAIQPLIDVLGDPNWEIRKHAVEALAEMDDPAVVQPLGRLVNDPHVQVRKITVYKLGEFEDSRSVPFLISALQDKEWEVRKHAAESLGDIADASAVDALCLTLHDENAEVRKHAAESLGDIEDLKAVVPLTALLADPEWEVRKEAVESLSELGGPEAVSMLNKSLLEDSNPEVRKHAAWALGEIEHISSVEPLIKALNDEFWEVRKYAARALGEIGDPRATDPLTARIKDENSEVRRAAARALGELR